jgi:hypothetical protein
MSRKSVSWILDFTSKLPNEEEKIKCLRANDDPVILTVLKLAYDPNLKWAIPEGPAPYVPCQYPNQDNMLYLEARRLYLFLEGVNPQMPDSKRQSLFLELLNVIDPKDAELIISIKDKKLPYPGLSSELILKAFPGLY